MAAAVLLLSLALLLAVTNQNSQHQEPLRRLTSEECNRLRRIIPVGDEATRIHHRQLTDCDKLADEFANDMPDDLKSAAEIARQKALERLKQSWNQEKQSWRDWVPTPDEAAADAIHDAAMAKLAKEKAEREQRVADSKKAQADADAARAKDNAARDQAMDQYTKDLETQQAQAVTEQANKAAREAEARQQAYDDAQAQAQKEQQQAIDQARETEKQQAAQDQANKAKDDAQAKADEAKRAEDQAQADVDEKERIADQQLADSEAKAQRQKDRDARAAQREADENAREQNAKDAQQREKERLEREEAAAKAESERVQKEKEFAEAEKAREAREKDAAAAEEKRVAKEEEFTKDEAERTKRLDDFEQAEKDREAREKARQDEEEERQKQQQKDQADENNTEDTPEEEKPKEDDEEPCDAKGSTSVTCEHGGKCFQKKDNPESKRCQCRKDHKGDKCEHTPCNCDEKPCTNPEQKGNLVKGKCIKWEASYACPKCNKPWEMDAKCVHLAKTGSKTATKDDCDGIREPTNKFEKDICKLCEGTCELPNTSSKSRRLSPAPAGTYEYGCGNAMIISHEPHIRPASHQPIAATIQAQTFEQCQTKCVNARGPITIPSAQKADNPLTGSHCTWIFWIATAPGKVSSAGSPQGTCYLLNSGVIPEYAAASDGQPTNGNAGAGFMGFISFPRRFDIYRQRKCTSTVRKFEVGVGFSHATHSVCCTQGTTEHSGTFYMGTSVLNPNDGECVADGNTMLDNSYEFDRISIARKLTTSVKKGFVPDADRTPHMAYHTTVAPISVPTKNPATPITWQYSMDSLRRVTAVRGIQIPANVGKKREFSPKQFEDFFRYLMYQPLVKTLGQAANNLDLSFQSGHLIPAIQGPPNFFFNYVPQHQMSNSCNGCWFTTEEMAIMFLRMKCHLDYHIQLSYRANDNSPSAGYTNLPPSARYDKTGFEHRVDDTFKCHYRYRPFKMWLSFQIVNAESNSICTNLIDGGFGPNGPYKQLVEVHPATTTAAGGFMFKTSRVMAYLLQRKAADNNNIVKDANEVSKLERLRMVATTMGAAPASEVACYAETGMPYDFADAELTPEFHNAFLSQGDNEKCLGWDGVSLALVSANCLKWIYQLNSREVWTSINGISGCIALNVNPPAILPPVTPGIKCAHFTYMLQPPTLNKADLFDSTTGDWKAFPVEDLVFGLITDPSETYCMTPQLTFVLISVAKPSLIPPYGDVCVQLRVTYYNVGTRRRRMRGLGSEDDADEDDDDGDDDDDEDTCALDSSA